MMHGKGVLVCSDYRRSIGSVVVSGGSREFQGVWIRGQLHGNGTLKYSDGRLYEGSFENGLRHGFGKMSFPDGRFYEGGWVND